MLSRKSASPSYNRSSTPHVTEKKFKRYSQSPDLTKSQDIWKNLDRLRYKNPNATTVIKRSYLFIPVARISKTLELCVEKLKSHVGSKKIELQYLDSHANAGYIVLRDFNVLDCCLVLPVVFALNSKMWLKSNLTSEFFNIPRDLMLGGHIYLPQNCQWSRAKFCSFLGKLKLTDFDVTVSNFGLGSPFKDCHLKVGANADLSSFMTGVAVFVGQLKFGRNIKQFPTQYKIFMSGATKSIETSILQVSHPGNIFFDQNFIEKRNSPLISASIIVIDNYIKKLEQFNEPPRQPAPVASPATATTTQSNIQSRITQRQIQHNPQTGGLTSASMSNAGSTSLTRQGGGRALGNDFTRNQISNPGGVPNNFGQQHVSQINRPGFLTQDEIKQHCLATIKASREYVKARSPYQIFKVFVKVPRQLYADKVFQNLNELRAQTSCNIVVLNLNNLHESEPWFKTLDLSSYTNILQTPHTSTVRVVSIGGVGEYIVKATDTILSMLNS